MVTMFDNNLISILKKDDKYKLKYSNWKALGWLSGISCGYFSSTYIILIKKFTEIVNYTEVYHSVCYCSGRLNLIKLICSISIHISKIHIFGIPVFLDDGFGMLSQNIDVIEDIEDLFKN